MKVKVEFIGRGEVEAPSILYKYRRWDKHLHRTLLSLQTVYMAAPSTFEDEKEFRNFKVYDDLTDEEIFAKYLAFSLRDNPHYTREQHNRHAETWTKRAPFKNKEHLRSLQEVEYWKYDKMVGILSVTEFKDSLAMWNYYSDNGKGFCVGLDTKVLFNYIGGGGKVDYPKDGLPVIYGNDEPLVERWKQTFNKEVKWTFEQEYRTSIFKLDGLSTSDRKIKLPHHGIREVIFGWDMLPKYKAKLKKLCLHSRLDVQFYQAIRGHDPVKIEIA